MSGMVSIGGCYETNKILKASLEMKCGQHGILQILFSVPETEKEAFDNIQNDGLIKLYVDKKLIFAGLVQEKILKQKGANYFEGELKVLSKSILADRVKAERSFQDRKMSYIEVMNQTAEVVSDVDLSMAIGVPIIQYAETPWQFIKRLSSRFFYCVYPDYIGNGNAIFVGMPSSRKNITINSKAYSIELSEKYYTQYSGSSKKEDSIYYKYEDTDYYPIGTKVTLNGKSAYVFEITASFEKEELIFTYSIGDKSLAVEKPIKNYDLVGRTILGTVLSTQNETVKVHLDIDELQDEATAYPFYWTPDSGNVMYCMPKIGTRVSLFYGDTDDTPGSVIHCVRTNSGDSCFSKPSDRQLSTEHGKVLKLADLELSLSASFEEQMNAWLSLLDGQNITLGSKTNIGLIATGKISMTATDVVSYEAGGVEGVKFMKPNALILGKSRQTTGFSGIRSSLALQNDVNMLATQGKKVYMNLSSSCSYPRISDAPEEFDMFQFVCNCIVAAAAVVLGTCLVLLATAATGGAAAAIIIGGICAGAAIGHTIATNDYEHSRNSSWVAYLVGPLIGSIVGGYLSYLLLPETLAARQVLMYKVGEEWIKYTGYSYFWRYTMIASMAFLTNKSIYHIATGTEPNSKALLLDYILGMMFGYHTNSLPSWANSDIAGFLFDLDPDESGDEYNSISGEMAEEAFGY